MSVPSRRAPATTDRSRRSPDGGVAATLGIVALAISLLWAGTHELGALYAERPLFSSLRWLGSLALIAASGFVFSNVMRPVDVRARVDWVRSGAVVGIPVVILAYCWFSLEFQYDNRFLDTVLAWASPFGHGILAALIGIGVTAGMPTRR